MKKKYLASLFDLFLLTVVIIIISIITEHVWAQASPNAAQENLSDDQIKDWTQFRCQNLFSQSLILRESRLDELLRQGIIWKPQTSPLKPSALNIDWAMDVIVPTIPLETISQAETPYQNKNYVTNAKKTIVSQIVAMSQNGVIGRDGGLPWSLPEDYAYYLNQVTGRIVIAGRVTAQAWDEEGAQMEDRCEVVLLSRDKNFERPGCMIKSNIDEALDYCDSRSQHCGEEIFILGGQQIYELTRPYTDRIYVTEIDQVVSDGDTFFPPVDLNQFQLVERVPRSQNGLDFSYTVYERIPDEK